MDSIAGSNVGPAQRVFLSHTSDLGQPTQRESFVGAAVAAVLRARHAVTDMAYFTARDTSPADYCTAMVSQSDVYVGIIGRKYGAPVRDRPELSYTELEFESATERGLPRLIFLIREANFSLRGLPRLIFPIRNASPFPPTGHSARQHAFRDRLMAAGLTVTLVASPAELEVALYQALVERAPGRPVAASVISDRRHRWRRDVYPPSALLRAEFEIVPFYGRTDALEDLRTWASSDREVGGRVYTGAGGMGKTRLMTEFCRRLGDEGWQAGFLNRATGASEWRVALDSLFVRDQLLLVIDYAETRQRDVVASLERAVARSARGRVRIVLLARSLGDWWLHLTALNGRIGEILNGPATNLVSLRPVAPDPVERRRLFEQAAGAFQRVVPGAHPPTRPSLEARHYDSALYVLITALAGIHDEAVETESDLLDWALRRERQFLDDGVASLAGGQLKGRPILQCAAVATLAGRTNGRAEAAMLLSSSAPLLGGQPAAVVDAIAELLHRLYPGEAWLEGVQPDLLGEHLVERALLEDPGLLGAVFGSAE